VTIARDVALVIARHANGEGMRTMTIRLDPVELGRVEVRMQFDATGKLAATITVDHPAALDLLRRDSAMLAQTLSDVGVQADATSFRFDARSGDASLGGSTTGGSGAGGSGPGHGRGWAHATAPSRTTLAGDAAVRGATDGVSLRGLHASGRIDLVA
jgi:hypothetical protein